MFARYIRPAGCLIIAMTMLLGVVYPLAITGLSRAVFPSQAAGSLIHRRQYTCRFPAHRPKILRPEVFLGPAITQPLRRRTTA